MHSAWYCQTGSALSCTLHPNHLRCISFPWVKSYLAFGVPTNSVNGYNFSQFEVDPGESLAET